MNYLDNISRIMDQKQMNASALADRAGISRQAVYNMFRRQSDPSITTLDKFAKALGVTIVELITPPAIDPDPIQLSFLGRLRMALSVLEMNDSSLTSKLDIRPELIFSVLNGEKPTFDFILAISTCDEFHKIDLRWLVSGIGEMYLPKPYAGSVEEKMLNQLMEMASKGRN